MSPGTWDRLKQQTAPFRLGPDSALIRCTCTARTTGAQCKNPATGHSLGRGRPLCRMHGGCPPGTSAKRSVGSKARRADWTLRGLILRGQIAVEEL